MCRNKTKEREKEMTDDYKVGLYTQGERFTEDVQSGMSVTDLNPGMDGFAEGIPYCKVEYDTSGYNPDKKGWFYMSTGEHYKTIKVVWLLSKLGRVYLKPIVGGNPPEKIPVCRSNDGYSPAPDGCSDPKTGPCTENTGGRLNPICTHAKFNFDEENNKYIKPRCQEVRTLLFYNLENETPFNLPFKGIVQNGVKDMLKTFMREKRNFPNKVSPKQENLGIAMTLVTNPKGLYYEILMPFMSDKGKKMWSKLDDEQTSNMMRTQRELAPFFFSRGSEPSSSSASSDNSDLPF